MADIDWTISGRILVEDWMTVNAVVDRDRNVGENRIDRPMRNVKVQVSGAATGGIFKQWGTTRTGNDGSFSVSVRKSDKPRRIRVRVRLRDGKLQVKENVGPTAPEWQTVYDSEEKRDGPDIDVGDRVFRAGANAYPALFGYQSRVRALYWYLIRTVITALEDHDPQFGFRERVTLIFPCARDISSAWAGAARIERDSGNLVTVLHEVMHLWNYQHNTGTSSWVRAWLDGGDTANIQEFPSIAFHEGFAEYAAWELAYLIWGENGIEGVGTDPGVVPIQKGLPYSRRNLSVNRDLSTLRRVERNDHGVMSGLRMLTAERLAGLVLGTADDWPNPPGDEFVYTGIVTPPAHCPQGPLMTFWHVLKTFFPHPSKGWGYYWEVANDDWGLLQFLRRANEINPTCLTQRSHDFLVRLIDPEKSVQPWQECRDLSVCTAGWAPETIQAHRPNVNPEKDRKRATLAQARKNRHRKPTTTKRRPSPTPERRRRK